jgi:hypothetical protein
MKKTLALICAVFLLCSLFTPSASAEDGSGNASDKDILVLDRLVWVAHNVQVSYPRGEVRICPAVLKDGDTSREVYFVTVRSLDRLSKGANNLLGALRLTFGGSCRYFELTKQAIFEYVPEGSAIVIAGHSMGGMVVQRIVCDGDLTQSYEFLNAVTFGSPCILTDKSAREGRLIRFEDAGDIIPKFSLARLFDRDEYNSAVRRDCGYNSLDESHNRTYYASSEWEAFDALGVENGGAVLELDLGGLVALAVRNTYYFER